MGLDLFKIYPFVADRFIVYLLPLIILLFVDITELIPYFLKWLFVLVLFVMRVLNFKYIFYREQDYNKLANYLSKNSLLFVQKSEVPNFQFFKMNTANFVKKNIKIIECDRFNDSLLQHGDFYIGYYGTQLGDVDLSKIVFKDFSLDNLDSDQYQLKHVLGTGIVIQSKCN
jgi:hypothetical protein